MANRLNPRQAHWALFFTRFNFSLITLGLETSSQTLSLPAVCGGQGPGGGPRSFPSLHGSLPWDVERRFTTSQPGPSSAQSTLRSGEPEGRGVGVGSLFAPCLHVRSNQHKSPRQALAGLLQPLTVPRCPWSHISVDLVTGLPCSGGNSVIFTIVYRFSKMAHFVPLPKLLSAKENAQLLVQHVFHLHVLPLDVVSDRGPQFSSVFWVL